MMGLIEIDRVTQHVHHNQQQTTTVVLLVRVRVQCRTLSDKPTSIIEGTSEKFLGPDRNRWLV